MRRLFLGLLCLSVLLPGRLQAQCAGQTTALVPFDEEQLTVGATVTVLTPAKYLNATVASLSVRGAPINYLYILTPTATSGHPLGTGFTTTLCGNASIKAFRAIRQTTDATLTVSYFRPK